MMKTISIAALSGALLGVVLLASDAGASRNSSGTYSLPAGNPVVSGTTISSTWANGTLADISTELTNSMDRAGRGAMTAPLQLASGTVAAPGLTFSSEPGTGLYRNALNDIRMSANGADLFRWSTLQTFHPSGVLATPGISFLAETNSGFYRNGLNDLRFAVNGADSQKWTTTGITQFVPVEVAGVTATGDTSPALTTTVDPGSAKLLWALGSTGLKTRLYLDSAKQLVVMVNAVWSGTQWVPDTTASVTKFRFTNGSFSIYPTVAGTAGVGLNDGLFTGGASLASAALSLPGDVAINTNKFTVAGASGNTVVAGTFGVTGDVAVNTNKFTVAAASGNTTVAGTLGVTGDVAVNTNKFTVAATSGNTAVAGTLSATGNFAVNTDRITVNATTGNTVIAGSLSIGSNAVAISSSPRGTASVTPGSLAAQTCVLISSIAVSGSATGSDCSIGAPGVVLGITNNCYALSNACAIYACNVTTGALTPGAGTYSCRVFNP